MMSLNPLLLVGGVIGTVSVPVSYTHLKLFEKYRRRFSPYCSVASLYLWAAAGGAVPGLKDYAPTQKPKRKG